MHAMAVADIQWTLGPAGLAAIALCAIGAVLGLQRLRRQTRQVARLSAYTLLLAHINRAIADATDEGQFLRSICALTVEHAKVALTWIGRPGADGVFEYLASAGAQQGYLDGLIISADAQRPEGQGTTGRAWREGRPYFNTVFGRTAFLSPWASRAARFGLRSSAAVPVRVDGVTWAVFTLYSSELQPFDDTLAGIINDLAGSISAGLQHIRLARDEIAAQRLNTALLDNLAAGIQVTRYPERVVERANPRMLQMLGLKPDASTVGFATREHFQDESAYERVGALAREVLLQGTGTLREVPLRRADGAPVWMDLYGSRLDLGDGVARIVWTHVDVSERREQEQRLRRLSAMRDALLDNTVVGIDLVQYPRRRIVEANTALARMLGYETREQLLDLQLSGIYASPDVDRRMREAVQQALRDGRAWISDVQVRRTDGAIAHLDLHGELLPGRDGDQQVIVWTMVDSTRRYLLEAELQRQANHDELTGLPNRRALRERLRHSIVRAQERGTSLAVGVLDLDDFKPVNDRYGHDVGDELLCSLVQRLQAVLRASDMLVRMGGDEFVLLLDELPQRAGNADLRARLAPLEQAMLRPLPVRGGDTVSIGMTMGVAVYPQDAGDSDALLRDADTAMYEAKARKASRETWWRRSGDPLPADPDDGDIDPFGVEASRILERIQGPIQDVTRQYAEAFDRRVASRPPAGQILQCLSLPARQRLKQALAAHLLAALSPQAHADECERRARHVGRAHALVGLSAGGVSLTLNEYRSMLRDRVQTLALYGPDRTRVMQIANARMQLELQSELTHMQEVYDSYNEHLARALPDAATTWTSMVRGEIDSLCELAGLRAAFVLRLSPDGLFFAEFSAGTGAGVLDVLLHDPMLQPSLDSRHACGSGLVAQAWRTEAIAHSDAALLDPRMTAWSTALRDAGVQSAVALPIKDARNGFVLALYGAYPHQFSSGWARTFIASLRTRWEQIAHSLRAEFTPLLWQEAAEYRRLLHSGGLEMHAQPVLDTRTGQVGKVELLARLRGADGQLIAPGRFLPAMDDADTNTLFRLGLEQALELQASCRARGRALDISLNVAPTTLLNGDTVMWIDQALRQHSSAASSLTLEILESQEFLDDRQAHAVHRLAALGTKLAIDDLGAGYSSLKRLVNLPFDVVKVDQALLRELRADPAKVLGLVSAIIRIGEDLGKTVVVEGVEDDAALEAMMFIGARHIQGYVVSRPLPASSLQAWLDAFRAPRDPHASIQTLLGAFAWQWAHLRRGEPGATTRTLEPLQGYVQAHRRHDLALVEALHRYQQADDETRRAECGRAMLELLQQRLGDDTPRPLAA